LKANVELTLDSRLSYATKADENTPNSISGQTLKWDSISVESGKSVLLKVYATLDVNTALGTLLQSTAILYLGVPDDFSDNNTVTLKSEVTGSYDPNDKLVTPQGAFTDGYVRDTTAFEYTINFQNLGTDTAFTVVVKDVIDKDLNITTLNMIDASHNYQMSIKGDTVIWTFNDILLPDDKVNEPASHGFVRFFIKQKANNPLGTEITNQAAIYFDFNPAIITNTTENIVNNDMVTAIEGGQVITDNHLMIYPNPFSGKLVVRLNENEAVFKLFNALGELVYQTTDLETINLAHLPQASYIYNISTESASYSGKLIKE
jgi:hypothetical protein